MFDMGNPKNHLDQIIKGDVHDGISYICTKESMDEKMANTYC
jgi:hypothetical protein